MSTKTNSFDQSKTFDQIYLFEKIFWSIYFVMSIAIIGLIMGYVVTALLFVLSGLTKFFPKLSLNLRYSAEYVQCRSIRFLLQIQPWLKCDHNFQNIYGFYDKYKTRKIIFVCNHRSNLDTFFMISFIPGLRGLAKSSLYYNIFFAPMMWLIGFIPVKKGDIHGFKNGLQQLRLKVLNQNKSALIFPETTRCDKNFISINKFSRAVFDICDTDTLIVPVYIHNTDQIMGRGDLLLYPYKKPIKFKIFQAIQPSQFATSSELCKFVWDTLAEEQKTSALSCN